MTFFVLAGIVRTGTWLPRSTELRPRLPPVPFAVPAALVAATLALVVVIPALARAAGVQPKAGCDLKLAVPVVKAFLSLVGRGVWLNDYSGDGDGIAANDDKVSPIPVALFDHSGRVVQHLDDCSVEHSIPEDIVGPGKPDCRTQAWGKIKSRTSGALMALPLIAGLEQHAVVQDAMEPVEPGSMIGRLPLAARLYPRVIMESGETVPVVKEGEAGVTPGRRRIQSLVPLQGLLQAPRQEPTPGLL